MQVSSRGFLKQIFLSDNEFFWLPPFQGHCPQTKFSRSMIFCAQASMALTSLILDFL